MRVLLASWLLGLLLAGLSGFAGAENLGYVVRDHSLGGGRGEVVASGIDPSLTRGGEADYLILPNLGIQRGDNLFHSFALFGVGPNEVALFSGHGAESLRNIVVRVTGGETSVIEGKLRSSVADADFYLLNPRGISIIEGGKIDSNIISSVFYSFQGSSVYLSTAEALAFGDEGFESAGEFRVENSSESFSLSSCCGGSPAAFVFDGNSAGAVLPPSSVQVLDLPRGTGVDRGQTFAAVAGQVIVKADLTAYDGLVGLVAVGNANVQVPVDLSRRTSTGGAPWWSGLGHEALVEVADGSEDQTQIRTDFSDFSSTHGEGRILLRGGALVVNGASFYSLGEEASGIDLAAAGSILVEEGSRLNDNSRGPVAGGIRIEGGSLEVVGGSTIASRAGEIFVEVTGDVRLDDSQLGTRSESGTMRAGDIKITAASSIRLHGRAGQRLTEISARGGEDASQGEGGDVTLDAPRIEILDGAAVSATTGGAGAAGNVTITGEILRIAGRKPGDFDQPSAVYSETIKFSDGGDGGTVSITVGHLVSLEEGGEISVETQGSGDAGSVFVNVENGSLQLRGGASINAASDVGFGATGMAGDIDVTVVEDVVLVDSEFRTDSLDDGGNVFVDALGNVELVRSAIETDVRGGGKGGNVEIGQEGVPRLVFLDSSEITATAVKGAGGNVEIAARGFLASADSVVDASSKLGINGVIDVSAPEVQVEGRLDPLPAGYLDVSALLRDHCAARRSAGASSFTLQGQPAIPPDPDDFLPSSLLSGDHTRAATAQRPPASLPLRAQLRTFDPSCRGSVLTLAIGG